MVISASNACNKGKFNDTVAKRRHFSINDVTKYTASGNSSDVTRGTKKTFQGQEHKLVVSCSDSPLGEHNLLSFEGEDGVYSDNNSEYGEDRNSERLQWRRISVQMIVGLDVSARITAAQPRTRTRQTGDSAMLAGTYSRS